MKTARSRTALIESREKSFTDKWKISTTHALEKPLKKFNANLTARSTAQLFCEKKSRE